MLGRCPEVSTTCDLLVRGAGRPGLVLLGDCQQGAERAGAAGLASPTPRPGDCARLRPRPSHGPFRGVTAAYVFFFFYVGLFMPRTKSPLRACSSAQCFPSPVFSSRLPDLAQATSLPTLHILPALDLFTPEASPHLPAQGLPRPHGLSPLSPQTL